MSPTPDDLERDAETTPEEAAGEAQRRLKHQRTVRSLRSEVKGLANKVESLERQNAVLLNHGKNPAVYRVKKPPKSKSNPIATIALCSDLHVEEVVDPATINGLNEHNLTIAEAKLERYWQNVVKLCKWAGYRTSHHCHVQWLGGDLFTGHIHDDLVEVTELSPIQSIRWLQARITGGLKYLLKELDCPIIVPCNYGNHGRTTLKPRIATAARHSYEWLLYSMLADPVSGPFKEEIKSGRITFLVATGYHQIVDLNGYLVRFHHGDSVKFYGGVGGLTIPLRKAVDSWNQSLYADLDCFGHFHQFVDLGFALGNGSLIGYTAYALSIKARLEPPQQAFAMIDLERKVKTGVFPVFVQ